MSTSPFPIDPVLTGIAMAYRNPASSYIADLVLPRMTPFEKEAFTYNKWTLAEGYTVPDTKVGRKSSPNEVEFTAARTPSQTADYGLDDILPVPDIANAAGTVDPRNHAVETLTDLIMIDREVRVAGLIFAAGTYPGANTVTLSGTSQWSDFTNSNPISDIMTALDTPVLRPNVAIFGRATFSKLIQHPKINNAVVGNAPNAGVVRRQQIAELFELEEVLVGESFVNTAKKGQAATMSRVWGKHAAFIYRNPLTRDVDGPITFGFTAQFNPPGSPTAPGLAARFAGSMPEPKTGLRGSERIRVGESVKEEISANDLGYFIQNAVA
jgi:hypothetical protein